MAELWDWSQPDFQLRIHDIYRSLRDAQPVYHHRERDCYALSRFEDVRAATNDPQLFSSERTWISTGLLPMLQSIDPPRHDALRKRVQQAFTPSRVQRMEPRIREIAGELIANFAPRGSADLLADFARHLPSRVIGEMIGVPAERREEFLHWTEALVALPEPGVSPERGQTPAMRIYAEFAELLEARRRERGDDLMSALIDAELDGRRLEQDELLGFCFVLLVAGNDTTTNLIGNGAVLLAEHPEQRRLLVEEPARIPAAIEEMLRYESPTQALPRRSTREVTLHGVTIPAERQVFLLWGSANRDEREFEEPDRFDVRRSIRHHLAFGQGVHFCLGANLARLEARVAFEELLARIPDYKVAAPPRWIDSMWARAHAAVPIAFPPFDAS